MKKFIGSLLAVAMMMSGVVGVAAQDTETAYGSGIGSPATWFDDRGNPVASVEVTDVIEDWTEHEANRGPARGYLYYAVVLDVTNLGSGDIEVSARDFSLVDTMGLNNARSSIAADPGSSIEVFSDTAPVAAGESAEFVVVYELFSDVSPAMLVWQADSGQLVLVNLSDGNQEPSAVVQGMNTPATWSDDRGNEVATIEVTNLTDDWQDHDPNRAADRGSRYVAVSFTITNISDASFEVNPYNLSLVDTEGTNNSTSSVRAAEDGETVLFSDRQDLAPGESVEGTIVFQLFSGIDPVGMIWQPEYGILNVVVLVEGSDVAATPELDTDQLEDLDPFATPAS